MLRRVLAVCACAIALVGCRLDIAVDMVVEPDGTGTLSVTVIADAELVAAVPTIADELATDDAVAAGWVIDGPVDTPSGGLSITLTHDFASDAEATNLLASLGPPFNEMSMTRNTSGEDATTRLNGLLGLPDGFESFADEDLIAAVGTVPFADELAAAGATPETSLGATIRVTLPGSVDDAQTTGTELGDGRLEWVVPVDGSVLDWRAVAVQSAAEDRWWARPLSVIALVALVAWIAFMTVFIGYVAWVRWQRTSRARRRPGPVR
ncbi:MAG TPA: hypothetical protein VK853_10615 [Ilumatobacteraceae bacterium]|nr:hypothetical protein [Ilumatobacteraceae bacterium]